MANIYYANSDNLLDIVGLRNDAGGVYLDSATVTVTVKDFAGAEVAGETWPLVASHVFGSNGDYYAVLADTLVLTLGLDAFEGDPFAGLAVTTQGFGQIGRAVAAMGLPTVIVQEGGYLCPELGQNLDAVLRAFL